MALPQPPLPRHARRLISFGVRLGMSAPRTLAFAAEQLLSVEAPRHPAPNLSAAFLAQVAVDELILAAMQSPGRFPSDDDYAVAQREILATHDLVGARGWQDDPRSFHGDPGAPDTVDIDGARWIGPGWEHLRFHSDFEAQPGLPGRDRWSGYENNRVAHAWMLRKPGPRPWVVCVHPFGTGNGLIDARIFRARAMHNELGVNVLLPVLPLHGPRRHSRPSGGAFMTYNLVDVLHGLTQSTWDVRRLLAWVREQDATATAMHGVSLGAHVSSLVAAFEPRLDAVVVGVPTCDMVDLFARHIPSRLSHKAIENRLIGPEARAVHSLVSPLSLAPAVSRDKLFVYAATGDRMAPPEQAHLLWRHWGEPEMRWFDTNHVAFLWSGGITSFVRSTLASALDLGQAA